LRKEQSRPVNDLSAAPGDDWISWRPATNGHHCDPHALFGRLAQQGRHHDSGVIMPPNGQHQQHPTKRVLVNLPVLGHAPTFEITYSVDGDIEIWKDAVRRGGNASRFARSPVRRIAGSPHPFPFWTPTSSASPSREKKFPNKVLARQQAKSLFQTGVYDGPTTFGGARGRARLTESWPGPNFRAHRRVRTTRAAYLGSSHYRGRPMTSGRRSITQFNPFT